MDVTQLKIANVFHRSYCGLCGSDEINQYFGVNDNYIEYCGVFHSLSEILRESMDFQIDHNEGKSMEICSDCKEKVVNFYHFKRRVKENQLQPKKISQSTAHSRKSEKRSKLVHNIYDIIENYVRKCSVANICVDESAKKLIIESSELVNIQQEASVEIKNEKSAVDLIKDEPYEDVDVIKYNPTNNETTNDYDDDEYYDDYDTSDYNSIPSTSQNPISSQPPLKRIRDISAYEAFRITDFASKCQMQFPVNSEDELYQLAFYVTENSEFEYDLGQEMLRNLRQYYEGPEQNIKSIIRLALRSLISTEICQQMNTSGRASKSLKEDVMMKTIKAPEGIIKFIAKYVSILSNIPEQDVIRNVRGVIIRMISDYRKNIRQKMESEMRKLMKKKSVRNSNKYPKKFS